MAVSRYSRVPRIQEGFAIGTSTVSDVIRQAVKTGRVSYTTHVVREGERLDTLSGSFYGTGSYWWILAAASGIGWGLQLPAGTVVYVPDLSSILQLVR
jgi:phage tail protein X